MANMSFYMFIKYQNTHFGEGWKYILPSVLFPFDPALAVLKLQLMSINCYSYLIIHDL